MHKVHVAKDAHDGAYFNLIFPAPRAKALSPAALEAHTEAAFRQTTELRGYPPPTLTARRAKALYRARVEDHARAVRQLAQGFSLTKELDEGTSFDAMVQARRAWVRARTLERARGAA